MVRLGNSRFRDIRSKFFKQQVSLANNSLTLTYGELVKLDREELNTRTRQVFLTQMVEVTNGRLKEAVERFVDTVRLGISDRGIPWPAFDAAPTP